MRILICGGSGFIGRHLVHAVLSAGHEAVVRSRHSQPALDFVSATAPAAWLEHLQGVDAVINAVGVLRDSRARPLEVMHTSAPMALFDACAQAGVRRVVQISALGIDGNPTRYASSKRAADAHLLALTQAGQLDGTVIRPSVVFGKGGASSEMFMGLARLPALLLPAPVRRARVQPVAARDLAEAVVRITCNSANFSPALPRLVELGGPEPLPLAQLIASLRAQMKHRPALVASLPALITQLSARAGDLVPVSPWCSETLALLATDNVTDPATLTRILGRSGVAPAQLLQSTLDTTESVTNSVIDNSTDAPASAASQTGGL